MTDTIPPHPPPRTIPPGEPLQRIEIPPEEALKRGIIGTRIRRPVAWAMIVTFLLIAFGVPLVQLAAELSRGQRPQVLDLFTRAPVRQNLKQWEEALEKASGPKALFQPHLQQLLTRHGGFGNTNAVLGRAGWLYYRPGVDYLAGPGILDADRMRARRETLIEDGATDPRTDPREAILQFDRQCRDAGARLIVVPVPDKSVVQPAQLTSRLAYDQPVEPPNNPDFPALVAALRAAGVDVFDPTPAKLDPGDAPRFLVNDTHWTPQWMQAVAADLAEYATANVKLGRAPAGSALRVEETRVRRVGDLVDMLQLPAGQTMFPPQEVTVGRVVDAETGGPWHPSPDADVLLLGDSFTNIYSAEPMGWGDSAGFAEHLSHRLGRPLDRISRNDDGAHATRQMLSALLKRGKNRLAGKKVVVWQFAVRELTAGDWKLLDMTPGTPPPVQFVVPKPGEEMVVTGTIAAAARAPRPGSVPYKDHIIAVHLTDLATASGPVPGGEALVYVWSMRDNVWTDAARYRPDQRVTLKLRPWADVSDELDAINRSELDDDDLMLQEPCWGEGL
jgi:alginate O-acetyltransferase complex protein AlgJ